jgi:hypothetical protein
MYIRHNTGTSNTMFIGSGVCLGTGTGLGLMYPLKTVPYRGYTGLCSKTENIKSGLDQHIPWVFL